MRFTNALLSGVAALGLSTGAAFAGGDSVSQDSMSQDLMSQESFIPFEPSEPAISGNELG